ncbi:MAG TPA: tetratricopeptide repeat protein, partial [Treponemataceae bacterium]|nr:tetratricopeptide repeat protein [Treponemataceae bacterium]
MSLNLIDRRVVLGFLALIVLALAIFIPVRCSQVQKQALVNEREKERENTLVLVKKYVEKGEYERAMNLLDDLLIKNPHDEEALLFIDEIVQLKSGASLEDFPRYAQSIDLDTSELERAIGKMEEALRQQQAQQESVTKRQEDLAKMQAEELAEERKRKEQQELEAQKQKAYEEALAKESKELQAQIEKVNDEIALGKAKIGSGKTDEGLVHFNRVESLLPKNQDAFNAKKLSEIANVLYDSSLTQVDAKKKDALQKESQKFAEKALRFDKNDALAHYLLGKMFSDAKQFDKALEELTLAVQKEPSNYLYFYDLGKVQYSLRQYSEARSSFETSTKLQPSFEQGFFNLATTYKTLGRSEEALQAYRRAVTISPNYDRAHLEIARLL